MIGKAPADRSFPTSAKMTVTLVMSSLFPVHGIESAAISLMDELSATYRVRVITIADDVCTDSGAFHHPVESWGGKVTGWRRLQSVLRAYQHRHDLGEGAVILCGAWSAIPILLVLPRSARKRVLVWEHSFDSKKVKTNRNLAVLQTAARPLYRRANVTVTVSESLREDMRNAGFGGAIEVIPNFVRALPADSEETVPGRLLTVGRLIATKNHSLVLHAMARLPERYTLDVLGDGPDRQALERLVDELGLRHRVSFRGYCENPAGFYARSQIVVHPSLGETYGLVLFEASDFGKPVVAVNQSVMADIVPKLVPGVLADPRPESFVSAILGLDAEPIADGVFREAASRRAELANGVTRDWHRLIDHVAGGTR